MVKLIHTRPLAGRAAGHPEPRDASQVVVAEMPHRALVNLRLRPEHAATATAAAGAALPTQANTVTTGAAGNDGRRCLWLGPDEWLIQHVGGTGPDLAESLSTALAGLHHSAKDVSDNYATIRLSGPRARDVMAKLTPLDLHTSVFTTGQCAQTVMAKSSVILDVVADDETGLTLDISLRRSFAAYVWDRLIDAGLEYGVGVIGAE